MEVAVGWVADGQAGVGVSPNAWAIIVRMDLHLVTHRHFLFHAKPFSIHP
jgi:hypothetical protein